VEGVGASAGRGGEGIRERVGGERGVEGNGGGRRERIVLSRKDTDSG